MYVLTRGRAEWAKADSARIGEELSPDLNETVSLYALVGTGLGITAESYGNADIVYRLWQGRSCP